MIGRRSFLKFAGVAPIAAPVIAREAAAQAGVVAMPPADFSDFGEQSIGMAGDNGLPWLVEKLRDLDAADAFGKALEAVGKPRILDPDLASARSLSLSAAMRIQRERDARARLDRARMDALTEFKRTYGVDWGGIASWLGKPLERKL